MISTGWLYVWITTPPPTTIRTTTTRREDDKSTMVANVNRPTATCLVGIHHTPEVEEEAVNEAAIEGVEKTKVCGAWVTRNGRERERERVRE